MAKVEIDLDEITEQMRKLKDTKAELEFTLKQVGQDIELNQLKLIALLGQMGCKEMYYKTFNFGLKKKTRTAFDQKLFSQENKELYEKYKTTKESEQFYFKLNN